MTVGFAASASAQRFAVIPDVPPPMTPEELKRYTENETNRWTRLVKAAGIKGQ